MGMNEFEKAAIDMLKWKIKCTKSFAKKGNAPKDCGDCPLNENVEIKLSLEGDDTVTEGKIILNANACLLMSDIIRAVHWLQ
jgi:hypothetical protein